MTARDVLDLIWLVPALPALGAAVLLLAGKRIGEPRAGWLASLLMLGAFAWSVVELGALLSLPAGARQHVSTLYTWLPSGSLRVNLAFLADPLSVTFILFVTGVGTLIHFYSIGYMHGDRRFTLFFGYMNLFVTAMLILVLGSSFLVTFLGWEGVGLCSYLLISFWFERNSAAVAGKKAFVTTRVGDVGFMVGMFLIFSHLGSLDYSVMGAKAHTLGAGTALAISLLLFAGAIGKSAQIPLHFWLPDAMEGPTPVSALIHAATMVTAGVFLVARAHPFFAASGGSADTTVAWVGTITALLAGSVALVQPDIKRVLAYSTVSQLGYMFLALGLGAYGAAVFQVITHAFFKAALFLGAGSVIHGSDENQDIRTMGALRKFLPFTAIAFEVAWLAISGVPPFAGFWSKDDILSKAFYTHNYALWALGTIAALLTGFYMTREVWLVFFGNERFRAAPVVAGGADDHAHGATAAVADGDDPHLREEWLETPTVSYGEEPKPARMHHDPHEAPWIMTIPLLILSFLALIGGVIDLPFRALEHLNRFLDPVFAGVPTIRATSFVSAFELSTLSVVFGLVGIVLAWSMYRDGLRDPADDPVDARLGVWGRIFGHAYYFDEAIAAAVDGPVRKLSNALAGAFDQGVIDGAVNGVGRLFQDLGARLRRVQTGLVRQYAVGIVLGAAALLLYVLVRIG